jgi:predicted metal-dependent enzyme (double-stranded beta helix superfamily)
MAYTLEQLSADCRAAMDKDPGPKGRDEVRKCISKACADKDFVAKYLGPDNHEQRKVLYEDPKHKFCILAHVYEGAKDSSPHDHGPSWAIYGQATGVTTMTDWEKVAAPKDGQPGKVRKVRDYDMTPGVAYLYNEGVLHSPSRKETTRLIRVEGMDMSKVKRDKYEEVVAA